jgi:hypothetical protein
MGGTSAWPITVFFFLIKIIEHKTKDEARHSSALSWLRQEDRELEASLGCIVKNLPQKTKGKTKQKDGYI